MNILFLHLSDLHLENNKGINLFQIKKIIDTVHVYGDFNRLILIISGDIAKSGEAHQYVSAYKLVGNIIAGVKMDCGYSGFFDVLCVPGNHDINHNSNSMTSEYLQSIRKVNSYEKHLPAEIKKQEAFYNFAQRNHCFKDYDVFWRKTININGFVIEANMINSAVFSIIEEDKGLHFIPQHCINTINAPTGADFTITIMHHAPDWYIDSQKIQLEQAIYGKSSLVLLGHEHYIATKAVSHERNAAAFIQAGGCLCQNDDWTESEYHIGLLDTETLHYSLSKFTWNSSEKQYEVKEKIENTLTPKPSIEKQISMLPSYVAYLCEDIKHDISKDFRDYFVFPRIQSEEQNGLIGKEYVDEASFIDEILLRKKVLIVGDYNSGKSVLLKSLFLRLSSDYIVLFCDIGSIRGKNASRIIKNCFEDIYGDSQSDYDRFTQIPKDKKVLIIDDIDQIDPSDFDRFISQLGDTFEYFIFASKQVLDIDLVDRMKSFLETTDLIQKFRITPFYADKRHELIQKIVTIKINNTGSSDKITQLLSDAIKAQRRFIILDPDFIIKYVEYYCNNIGESTSNDSGVFSKVFEASLITAISKYQTKTLSVDKIFVLLSKIAHYIHFNKAYPIARTCVLDIIEEYNSDYGSRVNSVEAINIMIKSKVLIPTEDGDGYRFVNKNYLAFFVAREVNSQYNATGDDRDLQKILQCSCFGINSDILLFISYITDNIRVLRLIIQLVNQYTSGWEEFDFERNMPQFFKSERTHIVELPPADARKKEKEAEVMAEKSISTELKTVDIYDYSDEAIDEFINQIIRACSLLIVVAKCLPNFEHNMPKGDKDEFINVIYRLPNKIFQLWAHEVDKGKDEIIQYFKEQSQDYYNRQKEITDDDILRAFQWGAMSLLLDLYNLSVFYSTKDNTIQYLGEFAYETSETHSLEYLMMLEKQNASSSFVEIASSLADKKNWVLSTILARIVNHALVFMDLDFRQLQRLKDKFFPSKEKQKELMTQRIISSNMTNE